MSTGSVATAAGMQDRIDAVQRFVLHHLQDSSTFSLPGLSFRLPAGLSSHGVLVLLASGLLLLVFGVFYRRGPSVPRGLTNALEAFVIFIRDEISIRYLGSDDGRRMAPLFCSLFFFILSVNLLGLIPCFGAATANISVTGALAAVALGVMVVGTVVTKGPVHFLKGFLPHGVPWPVLILLAPLEVLGMLIKCVALTIRLFANMLAGHMVAFFLLGMIVIMGAWAIPVGLVAVGMYVFELAVAFLQAYIFTLLAAVFIGQRYHPEH